MMFERRDIKTRSLCDGTVLTIPVFFFQGRDPSAPSLYLQSSIHGAEVQGYAVALSFIEHFLKEPPLGNVTIVPTANPYGMNQKMGEYTFGRFDPATGQNWNRHYLNISCLTSEECSSSQQINAQAFVQQHNSLSFEELVSPYKQALQQALSLALEKPQSYAMKLNLQLQLLACQADVVFDLHCDTLSLPHVYCASYAVERGKQLGFPYLIEIPHVFRGAFDEAAFLPWWHLSEAYHQHHPYSALPPPHFEAFTLELGAQEQISLKEAQTQFQNLLSYLKSRGVAQNTPSLHPFNAPKSATHVTQLKDLVTLYSPQGGLIVDNYPLGQEASPHQPLMWISSLAELQPEKMSHDDIILQSSLAITYPSTCIPLTRISTANVHEGMEVMKILVKP